MDIEVLQVGEEPVSQVGWCLGPTAKLKNQIKGSFKGMVQTCSTLHLFGKRFLCQLFSCSPRYWGFDSEPLHSTLPIVHLLFASLEPPGPEVRIGQVKFGSRFKAMAQA